MDVSIHKSVLIMFCYCSVMISVRSNHHMVFDDGIVKVMFTKQLASEYVQIDHIRAFFNIVSTGGGGDFPLQAQCFPL